MRTIWIWTIASALCYQLSVEPTLAAFSCRPHTAQAALNSQGKDSQGSKDVFHLISGNEGIAEDGTVLSMQLFEGPNGVRVAFTQGKFATIERAKKEAADAKKDTKQIIEQKPVTDSSGIVIGGRVVTLFDNAVTHKEFTAIFWTEGPSYYWISSSSKSAAFDFEERVRARRNKNGG
jgi:hypothetical protein